jgi:drug/metabolite transporter (DMT)-like permease
MVSLYVAIGLASSRQQVLEVALINYLWPALTLVFAVPILRKKARAWLFVGIFIGFTGILFSMLPESFSWILFADNVKANWLPYLLASVAGVTWALYSNLSRLWGRIVRAEESLFFFLFLGWRLRF